MFAILRLPTAVIAGLLLFSAFKSAMAVPLEFDAGFIADFGSPHSVVKSELETMLKERDLGPGLYLVGISINQDFFGQREIRFIRQNDELVPCYSPKLLTEMGIKLEPGDAGEDGDYECVDLKKRVALSKSRFNMQKLLLEISVPQINMTTAVRGYVSPKEWDEGVNAAFMNYQFSGSQNNNQYSRETGYNLYLSGGINLGNWRFRSNSSYQKDGRWERSNSYAQRDMPGTIGTLTVGESVTAGDMLQSIPYRGIQLSTDVEMLPDSLQGYAPIIRGIAQTQARVEVRQHGYSIYSTFVPPGPFEIHDLNAANGSGDLEIVVIEADGTERRFIQPYATLGNLLRAGTWRYNITAGQYSQQNSDIEQPMFGQASLAYGFENDYTLSAAGLLSESYHAYQFGIGKGLGRFGALSLDITQSATQTLQGSISGQSYGLRYGKAFETGTNIRFVGYRYSTEGYRDFSEAVIEDARGLSKYASFGALHRRRRLETNISQTLAASTSMYLNMTQQDYWNTSRSQRQLQFGVSTQIATTNITFYASKSLSDRKNEDLQMGLTVSFPLGNQNASMSMDRNSDGSNDQRIGLSGVNGLYNDVTYNVDISHNERSANTASGAVGYRAPWANLNAGMSSSTDYNTANLGVSGSILAHQGGIHLGQSLGETMALVEVKDTPNVGVNNAPGTLTDSNGYSLVPYVQPYRRNRISLDTSQLDTNTDIENGVSSVTPRRGAVVVARFKASHTQKVLATVTLANGNFAPFGAAVIDSQGERINAIGQRGQVLLSVSDDNIYHLSWGSQSDQQCSVKIDLALTYEDEDFKVTEVMCRSVGR